MLFMVFYLYIYLFVFKFQVVQRLLLSFLILLNTSWTQSAFYTPSIRTFFNLQGNMWKCCKSRDYFIFLIYQLSVCADAFGSWGDLCSCKQSPRCLNGATPQQSSSVFSMPVGSPASTRPPNTSALTLLAVVSEALCFLDVLSPCITVPSLYFGGFARCRGPLLWRCHRARRCTALFGGWLLDATLCPGSWSGASSFPSSLHPPVPLCLPVSQLVYTRRPLKESTKIIQPLQ